MGVTTETARIKRHNLMKRIIWVMMANQLYAQGTGMEVQSTHKYKPSIARQTENVHALEGLACRKRVTPASSPAAPASRVRRSRRLRSTRAAAPGLLAHALVKKQ
jgi:hypothetical protein